MPWPATALGWVPDWPVAGRVKAFFSTRQGGVSPAPWNAFNLGDHVGDAPALVSHNRAQLAHTLGALPVFLQQVHGLDVIDIDAQTPPGRRADACWTDQPGVACTIMVADCLPVLFTDPSGTWVAAAHAGWRGLAGQNGWGVLEATLAHVLTSKASQSLQAQDVQVWLGPCIGPQAFQVGAEVREAFCVGHPEATPAFTPQGESHYLADLALLARWRLQRAGVSAIFGNDGTPGWCTHSQESLFFSHRRDAARLGATGRMAACIWLDRA